MRETLVLLGIACVIAAVVGGGVKLSKIELPTVASVRRQILLAAVGIVLAIGGLFFFPEPFVSMDNGTGLTRESNIEKNPQSVAFTVTAKLWKDQESGNYSLYINGRKAGVLRIGDGQRESKIKVAVNGRGVHGYSIQGKEEVFYYDDNGTRRDYAQLREVTGQGQISVEQGKNFRINYSVRLGTPHGNLLSLILSDTDLTDSGD